MSNGGDRIARVLERHGVPALFTLCGGHISPILVGAKRRGIRVVDVRHEANAVFAADATARLSGIPGVAAVTAGPGATNSITAVKNAQMAQSPVILLGGATATVLRGRGSLQDIDQLALYRPHVKSATRVGRVREIVPALERAFEIAMDGVPGPVFLEIPVDLLYDESTIRDWYSKKTEIKQGASAGARLTAWYLRWHLDRIFADPGGETGGQAVIPVPPAPGAEEVRKARERLSGSERPVLLVGSQATLRAAEIEALAASVERLGIPTYLSGMARGLLGRSHPILFRHGRKKALREADLAILAGVPCDFRLDYGSHISKKAVLISANRSRQDLRNNRRPTLGVHADPHEFLTRLAANHAGSGREAWLGTLRARDGEREAEIQEMSGQEAEHLNPLALCRAIDGALDEDSVLVADGGDFVATASYVTAPRGPLRWLDPGAFGTLGVGAGFALGAKLLRPEAEVWILYGDGSVGFSLAEFDTFVRHGLPVIAVVGNDASWAQIARDQVPMLGDDVGTVLRRTDYHRVAEGLGGKGYLLDRPGDTEAVLEQAKEDARSGKPVLVNAWIDTTDFRKGSLSM